ncbi:MAG: hypothetical protein P8Y23_04245 [Candidatus Lokiarchaeota archaeon]
MLEKNNTKLENTYKPKVKVIKCDICHKDLNKKAILYHTAINDKTICEICYKTFSKDEIELMVNLFSAYGGYFGKYQKLKASVYIRLKELNGTKVEQDALSGAEGLNLQLLHAALQFGFTPNEYFQGLLIKK